MSAAMPNRSQQAGRRLAKLSSHAKGSRFENQVQTILAEAKARSEGRLTFVVKPRLELQSDEIAVPDFRITVTHQHVERNFLLECQNRSRATKAIVQKILYIRSKHHAKTFIFVHARRVGSEFTRTLEREGIQCLSLDCFREFIFYEAVAAARSWQIPQTVISPSSQPTYRVAFHSDPDARNQIEEWLKDAPAPEKDSAVEGQMLY